MNNLSVGWIDIGYQMYSHPSQKRHNSQSFEKNWFTGNVMLKMIENSFKSRSIADH